MNPRRAKLLVRTIAAMCAAGLTGACNWLPESATASLYTLNASSAQAQTRCAVSVAIRDLRLASYLDRLEIITQRQSSQLALSSLHLWAAPLKEELRRATGRSLTNRWRESRLLTHPWRLGDSPDLALDLYIDQLEPVAGNLQVQIDWRLLQPAAKVLADGQIRRSILMSGTNAAATVAAVETAVAQLSDEIAASPSKYPALSTLCQR